jgi:hypothetical protein
MIGDMRPATPEELAVLAGVTSASRRAWQALSLDEASLVGDLWCRADLHPPGHLPVTDLEMDRLREIAAALESEGEDR